MKIEKKTIKKHDVFTISYEAFSKTTLNGVLVDFRIYGHWIKFSFVYG